MFKYAKKSLCLILSFMVFISVFTGSYAAETEYETVSLRANINGQKLTIKGELNNFIQDKQVSLTVRNPEGNLISMEQVVCDEDGQYQMLLTLDDTAPLGEYTVTVGGKAVDEAQTAVVTYNNEPYVYAYNWNADVVHQHRDGVSIPYRPQDKYISQQNPPSFTWPYVDSVDSFELIVCGDEALTDIKYEWEGLKLNVFTPEYTLDTGVQYYWSVRYFIGDEPSEWSQARRFRIDPDAHVAPMEDIDTIMARIPKDHPRVFTTPEKLEEFRNLKNTNEYSKLVYDKYLSEAKKYVSANVIYEDPKKEDADIDESASESVQGIQYTKYINHAAELMTDQLMACGFIYLIDKNAEIGEYGKKVLLKLSQWDVNGATSAEDATQANRLIAICMARAYDWLYDLLDLETEIPGILAVIKQRTDPIAIYPEYNRAENFYGSHSWTRYMYSGIVAYATYGEIEGYDKLLRDTIETFSMVPAWSYEDGGWGQGASYYDGRLIDKDFVDLLTLGDVVNFYDRAWFQNEYLYTTYAYPIGSYGGFGEGAGLILSESDKEITAGMKRTAYFTDSSYAKWYVENSAGMGSIYNWNDYYANKSDSVAAKPPKDMPLSHLFSDIGLAVMTSSLENPDRIQLSFRSSSYGTYNHSYSDNNGFLISAFGENLAIHSGYYDAYGSPHQRNISRETFSNNSITVDGGTGQRINSFKAKGKITNFVNHFDFDSVTGDATGAYNGNIGKFERSIIYVRPDIFVVVDDLEAKAGSEQSFEWWINALDEIEYTNNSALIKQGNARLKAQVQYPETVESKYYEGFYTPDGTYYPAESLYKDKAEHNKISFSTPKCTGTKMVVTMDVYNEGETEEKEVTTQYAEDGSYMKLSFENETTVIVNLKDVNEIITVDDIEFKGAAVTFNENSIMLTNGTYLKIGGNVLINSNDATPVTIAIGNDQLCISTEDDSDLSIDVSNKYFVLSSMDELKDEKGREASKEIGLNTSFDGEELLINAEKGSYILLTDGIISANSIIPQNISVEKTSDSSAELSWDEVSGCEYRVEINGVVYENISSPFSFDFSAGGEGIYRITLTASKNNISKSSTFLYNSGATDFYSYVKYSDGDRITAKAFVNPSDGKGVRMFAAAYNGEGILTEVNEATGTGEILVTSVNNNDTRTVKTFIFDNKKFKPLTKCATYNSNNTDLAGIYINGELIPGFNSSKATYSVNLSSYYVYPVVTAVAKDNSTKVVVKTDCANKKTTIVLTAQNGSTRSIAIYYTGTSNVKAYVTDVTQNVSKWADLSDELKQGSTDAGTKAGLPQLNPQQTYVVGSLAYGDRTQYKMGYINDLSGLEGCYCIPPSMGMSYKAFGSNTYDRAAWMQAFYYGLGEERGFKYPAFEGKSLDWYTFNLNTTANIYVVTYGNTPKFIDDTWKKLDLGTVLTFTTNTQFVYDDVYVKTVTVPENGSVTVTMKTPGTGDVKDGYYYLFVKPLSK